MSGLKIGAAVALALSSFPANAQLQRVDVELALLVDISGSITAGEFNLQRQGYANAFNNATLLSAFDAGRTAAVTFIYWSGVNEQRQVVGWTLLDSAAASQAFATAILGAARPFAGNTAIGDALNFATPLFASNAFDSDLQIIDVSGDGITNSGANTLAARNAALAAGIDQINGLPILGSEAGLLGFYQNNVQGGAGSFTIAATNFGTFDAAILQKLNREIVSPGGVPEPATWAMMMLGFGALGMAIRRRPRVAVSYAANPGACHA